MHIEICIEDASGEKFLDVMLPKLLVGGDVTWRVHGYKGIGRIPKNLTKGVDVKTKTLLDKLPNLLRGFAKTPGIDAVVFVVDTDDRDCAVFLAELKAVENSVHPSPNTTLFRLAIEEMEAWYFGDPAAIKKAYPSVKIIQIQNYQLDSVCGTWERLADAIVPGGAAKLKSDGWPASGVAKSEWAVRITPYMNPDENMSPSFQKFRDGMRDLMRI